LQFHCSFVTVPGIAAEAGHGPAKQLVEPALARPGGVPVGMHPVQRGKADSAFVQRQRRQRAAVEFVANVGLGCAAPI